MDLCNLSVIKSLMADAGIVFRKEFGQNFLINKMIPEDIADSCADFSEMMILEIMTGDGTSWGTHISRSISDWRIVIFK